MLCGDDPVEGGSGRNRSQEVSVVEESHREANGSQIVQKFMDGSKNSDFSLVTLQRMGI